MDSMIYVLFIAVIIPLLLTVFIVEKKSRLPMAFFIIGIFSSAFVSEINGLLYGVLDIPMQEFVLRVTPITEEVVKVIPILLYALMVSDDRDTLVSISMISGIGFAVLENAYVLLQSIESFSLLTAIVRGFGTGLMHGMCTLLVGFGISFVRKQRKIFGAGLFALLSLAITYHALFNMLIQSRLLILGALFPMLTYVPFFLKRNLGKKQEGKVVKKS